jgi:uncharacterized protein YqfB (UPF0267 family)
MTPPSEIKVDKKTYKTLRDFFLKFNQDSQMRTFSEYSYTNYKFTTLKIAQKAGISIGSLYQYYANKEAILFSLHKKEWLETISKLESIIKAKDIPSSKKIEILILNFFESEFQERKMRNTLISTGLLLKNTPEYISLENQAIKLVRKLLKEIYPNLKNKELNFKAEYLFVKITSIAENASSRVNSLNEMKQ